MTVYVCPRIDNCLLLFPCWMLHDMMNAVKLMVVDLN